jgi:FixJ family two-component response regulator
MINESMTLRNFTSSQDGSGNEFDQPFVLVVDDDKAVREAVQELMLSAGMKCVCFASTHELLQTDMLKRPGCLVLDVRMPGSSGLELQRHLAAIGIPKPIVFLTGYGDIPMSVDAMKAGAIDFLTKPVRGQILLDAVIAGINRDATDRTKSIAVTRNVERLGKLTPRERQIIRQVACGRLNKQIAFDLGISEVTVKLHRSQAMRKLEASSIGELIRIWESLPVSAREACLA